jgi:hypothetical protein
MHSKCFFSFRFTGQNTVHTRAAYLAQPNFLNLVSDNIWRIVKIVKLLLLQCYLPVHCYLLTLKPKHSQQEAVLRHCLSVSFR